MALTTATTLTLTVHMRRTLRRTGDQKNQMLQQTCCTWCNLRCLVGNFVLDLESNRNKKLIFLRLRLHVAARTNVHQSDERLSQAPGRFNFFHSDCSSSCSARLSLPSARRKIYTIYIYIYLYSYYMYAVYMLYIYNKIQQGNFQVEKNYRSPYLKLDSVVITVSRVQWHRISVKNLSIPLVGLQPYGGGQAPSTQVECCWASQMDGVTFLWQSQWNLKWTKCGLLQATNSIVAAWPTPPSYLGAPNAAEPGGNRRGMR